jgi:hypothetical protein
VNVVDMITVGLAVVCVSGCAASSEAASQDAPPLGWQVRKDSLWLSEGDVFTPPLVRIACFSGGELEVTVRALARDVDDAPPDPERMSVNAGALSLEGPIVWSVQADQRFPVLRISISSARLMQLADQAITFRTGGATFVTPQLDQQELGPLIKSCGSPS